MQGCVTSGAGAAWDEQAATAMVRAAVKRKRGMFSHYADLSDEDLVQSVLIEVRKAFPTFNPAKATFSTWVGMVAGRRLIDAWRHRDRQANRDAIGAVREKTVGPPEIDDGPDPEPQLHEWLREVYQAARRTFTEKRLRQGRRFHNVAQEVACCLLMEKLGLSSRGAEALFKDRPDLKAAVRFLHVPTQSWFVRAGEVASLFMGKSAESSGANKSEE